MVAASRGNRELLGPGMRLKGVDLSHLEGSTAMSPDYDGTALEDRGGVSLPGFRLPPLQFVTGRREIILDVLALCLDD